MLFTDAKGGNLCFFNDDLHWEQIQTELEMLITQLPVMYREEERIICINKRPIIVIT